MNEEFMKLEKLIIDSIGELKQSYNELKQDNEKLAADSKQNYERLEKSISSISGNYDELRKELKQDNEKLAADSKQNYERLEERISSDAKRQNSLNDAKMDALRFGSGRMDSPETPQYSPDGYALVEPYEEWPIDSPIKR